ARSGGFPIQLRGYPNDYSWPPDLLAVTRIFVTPRAATSQTTAPGWREATRRPNKQRGLRSSFTSGLFCSSKPCGRLANKAQRTRSWTRFIQKIARVGGPLIWGLSASMFVTDAA